MGMSMTNNQRPGIGCGKYEKDAENEYKVNKWRER
jgi:hypothetical protein